MSEMAIDRKKLFAVTLAVLAALLPLLFVPFAYNRLCAAVALSAAAVLTFCLVKKRKTFSIHKRQVLLLLTLCALVYLTLYYISGLAFGFAVVRARLTVRIAFLHLIPSALIIIATEIIRIVLLSQEGPAVKWLSFVLCFVAELLLGAGITGVNSINTFMDLVALTVLPAVTANILYHYVAGRYGALPNIAYRSIITLYTYFIWVGPVIPNVIEALIKILLPLAVYGFIDILYRKRQKKLSRRKSRWTWAGTAVGIALVVSVVMLISCQFRFGVLVIATPSMEGELNVGDAVIYERYDGQQIENGKIIIYSTGSGSRIVHRVINIQNVNGELRYYTKGDANEEADRGYVTGSDIVGIVGFKLTGAGAPSLWLRGLFK